MNKWHIMCVIFYVFGFYSLGTADILKQFWKVYKQTLSPKNLATHPDAKARVNFPSGAEADWGNELTFDQVKDQPTVKWAQTGRDQWYTLCLIEPDKKSWENYEIRGYRHWLVVNIPKDVVEEGEVLSKYKIGKSPMEKIPGNHTYVLLVYQQLWYMDFFGARLDGKELVGDRMNFDFQSFMREYLLFLPTFGNLFWINYGNQSTNTTV